MPLKIVRENAYNKERVCAISAFSKQDSLDAESRLRECYKKCIDSANSKDEAELFIPLLSEEGAGYQKEESMRIAIDEIDSFLLDNDRTVSLVVPGLSISAGLDSYIDRNFVKEERFETYRCNDSYMAIEEKPRKFGIPKRSNNKRLKMAEASVCAPCSMEEEEFSLEAEEVCFDEHESKLEERINHLSDTFSEYLIFLIKDKGMENAEVYKRAIVDKKTFSKIKNNPDYHPQKITALSLCVGAQLNLDESKDLLQRAGYALSPCDKTDIIFSYFIENKIYDMIELDIQLEEHGLPCIIS